MCVSTCILEQEKLKLKQCILYMPHSQCITWSIKTFLKENGNTLVNAM